jgi:hypothetical protein
LQQVRLVTKTSILVNARTQIPRWARLLSKTCTANCTKSGHPPVDGLHSIEKSILTNPHFSLTQKIEGVKQDCSLTASKFFQLVQRPGLKHNHLLGLGWEGG